MQKAEGRMQKGLAGPASPRSNAQSPKLIECGVRSASPRSAQFQSAVVPAQSKSECIRVVECEIWAGDGKGMKGIGIENIALPYIPLPVPVLYLRIDPDGGKAGGTPALPGMGSRKWQMANWQMAKVEWTGKER